MRPRRHRLTVEITDMSGELATKRVGQLVRGAIEHALTSPQRNYNLVFGWPGAEHLVNTQVKDPRRVAAAERRKK